MLTICQIIGDIKMNVIESINHMGYIESIVFGICILAIAIVLSMIQTENSINNRRK